MPTLPNNTSLVYKIFSGKADCIATSNRADAVPLDRLRSGNTSLLKAYAHLLDPADGAWRNRKPWNTGCRNVQSLIFSGNVPSAGLQPHSDFSQPIPRTFWRLLRMPPSALSARLNYTGHPHPGPAYCRPVCVDN